MGFCVNYFNAILDIERFSIPDFDLGNTFVSDVGFLFDSPAAKREWIYHGLFKGVGFSRFYGLLPVYRFKKKLIFFCENIF